MARTTWRGAIECCILAIPSRLILATESKGVEFHLLHDECLNRVQLKVWCPAHGSLIDRNETVKGYEWTPGRCVPVTDADLERLPIKSLRTIAIERFVRATELTGWLHFARQTYYVEPDPVALRAAALLAWALTKRRVVAVSRIVLTNREHLAVLYVRDGALALTTLPWPEEIRSSVEVALPALDFKPAERALAQNLVLAMQGPFEPTAYRDEHRAALVSLIEAKVAGNVPATAAAPERRPAIGDLMAALEASVAAARAKRKAETAETTPERQRTTRRANASDGAATAADRDRPTPALTPSPRRTRSAA